MFALLYFCCQGLIASGDDVLLETLRALEAASIVEEIAGRFRLTDTGVDSLEACLEASSPQEVFLPR